MHAFIEQKLMHLLERHEELTRLLSDTKIISDPRKFRDFSKEYATLEPILTCFKNLQHAQTQLAESQAMMKDPDPDIQELAKQERDAAKIKITAFTETLSMLLLPEDPNDQANVFLEIRGGAGGDEAAIFAGDLFRMYARYAEQKGWVVEIINCHHSEQGGYKEVVAKISGEAVYSHLKFESGAHRVQRVPETEAQGRVHTSTCTVAIMPEPAETEAISVNLSDCRVDTFRSSGAGGQHVNKTDSAIRITHLPSGLVVECQEERSQHKNRARAISLLQAKLIQAQTDKHTAEQAATRKSLVGTGDRSERIRTYNYSQGRLTDHRIGLTLYKLTDILNGDLDPVVEPLRQANQANLLSSLQQNPLS